MFFLLSFALSSVEEDIISELKSIHSSLRDIRTLLEAQRLSEPRLPILRPVIRPRLSNRLANNHILYYSNEPELSDSDPGTWGGPWPTRLTNKPEFADSDPGTWGGPWPTRLYNRLANNPILFEIDEPESDNSDPIIFEPLRWPGTPSQIHDIAADEVTDPFYISKRIVDPRIVGPSNSPSMQPRIGMHK